MYISMWRSIICMLDLGKKPQQLKTENKSIFLGRFERTNGRMLACSRAQSEADCHLCVMPTIALAFCSFFSCFFSNFWLNSNYLQCRPARDVQGEQEHFIILVYSMDLCSYFTWQEEAQKIKRAALGFDSSFFFILNVLRH